MLEAGKLRSFIMTKIWQEPRDEIFDVDSEMGPLTGAVLTRDKWRLLPVAVIFVLHMQLHVCCIKDFG